MAVEGTSRSRARLLVVLGSGETAPTMTAVHRAVLARLPPEPDARLLDTPYGFQENAGATTERIRNYFRDQVGVDTRPLALGRADTAGAATLEQAARAVRRADWVFAGPGSPSYAIRQLTATPIPAALRETARTGGALVFSSAAACTLGRLTAPVYELYKVGADPHWLPGLDLLAEARLDAVVVPHFDNAEGGRHDTRFCYLGEGRLRALEDLLPDGVWVLGVDEHTAALMDLEQDTLAVRGRGGVTVRTRAGAVAFPAGATVPLDRLRALAAGGAGPAATREATPARQPPADLAAVEGRFADALDRGDAPSALAAALEVERRLAGWSPDDPEGRERGRRVLRAMLVDLAAAAQAGLHEHRRLVAPFVAALLEVRASARQDGDFGLADRLRDRLAAGGVDVRDTPDGPAWTYREPRSSG